MELPEITLDMRAAARTNPGRWLHVIDPIFGQEDDVPPWGVIGAYPVDERGEIRETFTPNTDYRPSPKALRMPLPSNELERVMQLIHTRYRAQDDLLPVLLESTLLIYARSAQDQEVIGFPNHDGTVMVPACTSAVHVPPVWPGWREIRGRELVGRLNGHPLVVNPSGPVTAVVPAEDALGSRGLT